MAQSRRPVGAATLALTIALTACGPAGVEGDPDEVVPLPDTHVADELLARGGENIEAFSDLARDLDVEFSCAAGGMIQMCAVRDGDLVAILPLTDTAGAVAEVSAPDLSRPVRIPLDDAVHAVRSQGIRMDVQVLRDGEVVLTWSGPTSRSN